MMNPLSSIASDKQASLKMVKTQKSSENTEENELGEGGNRIPSRPLSCIIDENGISFPLGETPEFNAFEIYDSQEFLIAVFIDQFEFIDFLFSLKGAYLICLSTEDYNYFGWIEL